MQSKIAWTTESDQIGGFREITNDPTAIKSVSGGFTKLWIYGSTDPDNSNMSVVVDDINTIVDVIGPRTNQALIYESPFLGRKIHDLSIAPETNKQIILHSIYYSTNLTLVYDTPGSYKIILRPGKYAVDCFGA